LYVPVLDVSTVLAQVDRNPIRAAQLSQHGRTHRIRLVGATRLSDGGYVINVDVESHLIRGQERLDLAGVRRVEAGRARHGKQLSAEIAI